MPDVIIVAIISATGAIIGAFISAYAVIKAARLKENVTSTPTKKTTLTIGILIGGFAVIFGIITIQLVGLITSRINIPLLPIRVIQNSDFETKGDPTNTNPWKSFPLNQPHQLILSNEQAHSGESSLRLKINIQPLNTAKDEYAGIGLFQSDLPALQSEQIIACVAWVLIPEVETVQDNNIYAHIIGYVYEDDGSYMGVYSEDIKLIPGEWIPIFWGATYTAEFENFSFQSSNRKLRELYVSVWDYNNPYEGSVFFDDIILYAYKK